MLRRTRWLMSLVWLAAALPRVVEAVDVERHLRNHTGSLRRVRVRPAEPRRARRPRAAPDPQFGDAGRPLANVNSAVAAETIWRAETSM